MPVGLWASGLIGKRRKGKAHVGQAPKGKAHDQPQHRALDHQTQQDGIVAIDILVRAGHEHARLADKAGARAVLV